MNTRLKKRKIEDCIEEESLSDFILDDESYKDLEEDLDEKTHKIFTMVREEIRKTEPNIIDILHSNIHLSDKTELVQLYELYKTISFSEESIFLKKKIYEKLKQSEFKYKQYMKYTPKEHSSFQKEIDELEQYNEGQELKYSILNLNTTKKNKQIIYNNYKQLSNIPVENDEHHKLKHWLKWATCLPYDNYRTFPFNKKELTSFLSKVSKKLDEELYGMKNAKEQILIFLNAKILNPHMKKCSLGLIGQPGTGKTRLSRVLANILGFPFEQISLGGVSDPTFLKGHQYTYIGAQPGEIVKCLNRMKYKNGILFLDEYDKISDNKDLCSALLHITDSSQNSNFSDAFLNGINIDLSYLWFVYSMNEFPSDHALRDRMFIVEVPGYTLEDKINILQNYMLPKALSNIKMEKDSVSIPKDVAEYLVKKVSKENEQGVRSIEKAINCIVNKLMFIKNHQDKKGKLKFNVSFNMNKKVVFPLKLTQKHVDILLYNSSPYLGPLK